MPVDDVMNALGGAGQILIASVVAVILLILVLWILIPLTVIGLRSRVGEMKDDQRRILAALKDQQRTVDDLLNAMIDEQHTTNELLRKVIQAEDGEEARPAAPPRPSPSPRPYSGPEDAPTLDGRATDRGARPPRPLVADR